MKNYIILFDGVCNLCDTSVQFIIKNDKKNQFKFSSLQSNYGKAFLKERELSENSFNSIILYEPNIAYYTKSTAVLKIAKELGFPYNLSSILKIIPSVILDLFYSFIAKNRYRWLGKKDSCMLPTPELKEKFL